MADGATAPATQYLTSVEVAGFKSAKAPVRVNFRDITVLAGANSAGKSTVMQPLLLIKQTIEKPYDPGGLAIDGPLVRFSHADQLLSHRRPKTAAPRFSVCVGHGDAILTLLYGKSRQAGIEVVETVFDRGDTRFTWTLDTVFHSIGDIPVIQQGWPLWLSAELLARFPHGNARVIRDRAVLVGALLPEGLVMSAPAAILSAALRNMLYLPGLRGNPERFYAVSATGAHFPGAFTDYVASVVHHWFTHDDERHAMLEADLTLIGLASNLVTKPVDGAHIEIHVGGVSAAGRGRSKDTVNIADVGFGVSQTLPVLVALLAAEPNQMVYIEQPELHLHPKAQIAMADILLQAADRGVRVVIETHSNLLLLALQAAVAEGRIAPDRVSLNWFTRDAAGQTHVTEAQLDADGSYGDWPEDFGENELKLQDRFMTAVERNHAR